MKNYKIFVVIIVLIFVVNSAFSQVRRYSNDYLTIGVSARAMSLGNSVIANTGNYASGYYNPAGLTELDSRYAGALMHSEYFAGIAKYDYAAFAYKYSDSVGFAVSLIRLGIDDIQNTLFLYDDNGQINYDNIELFSVADYALMLSFGRKTNISGLSYGGNAKIIYRSEGSFAKAVGFGIDIGVKYRVGKFVFGADLQNATTTFTGWFYNLSDEMIAVLQETGNEIPHNSLELTMPLLNTGVYRSFKFNDNLRLNAEIDLNFTFDGQRNALVSFNPVSLYPQTGLELDYRHKLFVRAGVNNFQIIPDFANKADTTGNYFRENRLNFSPSIGLGFVYKRLQIDYALTNVGSVGAGLYSNIFSLAVRFD